MDSEIQKMQEARKNAGSWGNLAQSRLKAVMQYAGKRILDAGCSTGSYVQYLQQQGFESYGFDLLEYREWYNIQNSEYALANINNIPYSDNTFDTTICFEVLEHIEHIEYALNELDRVTNGNLIISVPNCVQPPEFRSAGLAFHHWIDRTHKNFFSQQSLASLLEQQGFKIEHISLINPVRPETLFLTGWHISHRSSNFLGKVANKIPFRRKYYMTILAVASKH